MSVLIALPILALGCSDDDDAGQFSVPTDTNLVAADATGLRSFDDGQNIIVLTFTAIKSGTEDRTVLHYAMDSLPSVFSTARLVISFENIDPGPPGGTLDIYAFTGDGEVSTNEWDSGTLVQGLEDIGGGRQVLSVDVTAQLLNARAASQSFLSFNLRGGSGADRYNVGTLSGLPAPLLVVTP